VIKMAGKVYVMNVNDSGSTQDFSPIAHYIKIENSGDYTAYISFNTSASTNNFPIFSGKIIEIGVKNISSLNAICDTGETTILLINSAGEL